MTIDMDKSIVDILEELESTPGNNAKKDILYTNKNNRLLKKVFIASQDPYVVYYVNKFKSPNFLTKQVVDDDVALTALIDEILPKLSGRDVTGNLAKELLWMAYQVLDERQQKWYTRIILKNLRIGVQESTVNKIWPNTIKGFTVALANTLKSEFIKEKGICILDKVTYPVRVEPKLDGLRCIVVKRDGKVTFYTRNGTILETMPTIKKFLEEGDFDDIVLDGEMMGRDWNESASVLMAKKTHKDDRNIVYNVFDYMSLNEWVDQKCTTTYEYRCQFVENMILSKLVQSAPIRIVPHITANNERELLEYFSKCMDEGFEGVMLKTIDTPYEFKRSDNILKLKPCVTYEGIIVANYEGRRGTKREGLFGGFEVMLSNGVITRVGSGFSDVLKSDIQLNGSDSFLEKFLEIEAQPDPLTNDGLTVDGKARFPVFVRFRDECDVDPKIKIKFDSNND